MTKLHRLYGFADHPEADTTIVEQHRDLANALGLDYDSITTFFRDYDRMLSRDRGPHCVKRRSATSSGGKVDKKPRGDISQSSDDGSEQRSDTSVMWSHSSPRTTTLRPRQTLIGRGDESIISPSQKVLLEEAPALQDVDLRQKGRSLDSDYCFPSGVKAHDLLGTAALSESSKSSPRTMVGYARF